MFASVNAYLQKIRRESIEMHDVCISVFHINYDTTQTTSKGLTVSATSVIGDTVGR